MTTCRNCGGQKIEVKREDLGFIKSSSGSKRIHHTVCICKNCGYTWATDGPLSRATDGSLLKNRKTERWTGCFAVMLLFVVIIPMLVLVMALLKGCKNSARRATTDFNYKITEDNVMYVTNPDEQYIITILKTVDGIIEICPATKNNDPNNLFERGATSVVFFSYDRINQEDIYGTDIINKGTDSGGCIEVFSNESDAKSREKKLKILGNSGSCVRLGTTIVRTSRELSFEEQDHLENDICRKLLQIETP